MQAVDHQNVTLFIEEYSRFLARADILGPSYTVESGTSLGAINLSQIDKIAGFIESIGFEKKNEFMNQLNTYFVSNPTNIPFGSSKWFLLIFLCLPPDFRKDQDH